MVVETLIFIGLLLMALLGIALAVLQLPGAWLILVSAAAYDWYCDWQRIGWKWLVGMAVLAAVAEVLDTTASLLAARKAGASRRAAIGALIGGFAGMIVLSVPVPIIGTVIGGLVGCFLGALLGELSVRDDLAAGAKAGVFATLGRLVGLMAKTAAALVIAGATVALAVKDLWHR